MSESLWDRIRSETAIRVSLNERVCGKCVYHIFEDDMTGTCSIGTAKGGREPEDYEKKYIIGGVWRPATLNDDSCEKFEARPVSKPLTTGTEGKDE